MRLATAALKELGFLRASGGTRRVRLARRQPFGDLHDREVAEHEIGDAERDETDVDDPSAVGDEVGSPQGPVRLEVEAGRPGVRLRRLGPGTKSCSSTWVQGVKAPYSRREGECSRAPCGSSRAR